MIGLPTAAGVARRASDAWHWIRRVPTRLRIATLDVRDAKRRAAQDRIGPSATERLDQLRTFYDRYTELVETLCDSARYGPTGQLEARYATLRQWMLAHYPPMRQLVVAHLRYDSSDARQGLDLHGQSADAFEALYLAPNLGEFLRADDGNMISRIERTREALIRYGDHLRQLAARENACA